MRNKILSLLFGLILLLSPICAQKVESPSQSDLPVVDNTETVQTVKHVVEFEPPKTSEFRFQYSNILESLTEEQIDRIVASLEESGDVSTEVGLSLQTTLLTLNAILEDKAFMENKVIYQAQEHYNLSESEVKRSLRSEQHIDFFFRTIMLFFLIYTFISLGKLFSLGNGVVRIDKVVQTLFSLVLELFAVWYVIRPMFSFFSNRDIETIKFLLQGI
jgi:hypothetical protein